MYGTTRLFADFAGALPARCVAKKVAYSTTEPETYDELEVRIRGELSAIDDDFFLIAESFSGPLAIRIGATPPPNLAGLVLVATFVRSPVPSWLRPLVHPVLFGRAPPRSIIRHSLVGREAADSLVNDVAEATGLVAPGVMATRAREILAVDVRQDLASIGLPVLFVAGSRDIKLRSNRSELEALNPRLRWVEIDAPHLVLQTAPQDAAETICDFVDEVLAAR